MRWDSDSVKERRKKQILNYYKKVDPEEVDKSYKPNLMSEIGRQVALTKMRTRKRYAFSYISRGMDKHFDKDYEKINSTNLQNRLWRIFSRYVPFVICLLIFVFH